MWRPLEISFVIKKFHIYTEKSNLLYTSHVLFMIHVKLIFFPFFFIDVELKFPYRDVSIKRGVNVKDDYDLLDEIGRYEDLTMKIKSIKTII